MLLPGRQRRAAQAEARSRSSFVARPFAYFPLSDGRSGHNPGVQVLQADWHDPSRAFHSLMADPGITLAFRFCRLIGTPLRVLSTLDGRSWLSGLPGSLEGRLIGTTLRSTHCWSILAFCRKGRSLRVAAVS